MRYIGSYKYDLQPLLVCEATVLNGLWVVRDYMTTNNSDTD